MKAQVFQMTGRKLFNKHDIWLFAGLISLALLLYSWRILSAAGAQYAEIIVDGRVIQTIPLARADDKTYTLFEPNVQIFITEGGASFYSSDCPDQICVHKGLLTRTGEIAVCMPNRTSLQIVGARRPGDGEVDTFAH